MVNHDHTKTYFEWSKTPAPDFCGYDSFRSIYYGTCNKLEKLEENEPPNQLLEWLLRSRRKTEDGRSVKGRRRSLLSGHVRSEFSGAISVQLMRKNPHFDVKIGI